VKAALALLKVRLWRRVLRANPDPTSSAGPFWRRHRDSFDYLFDFATIPSIFETTPTFLAVFLIGFVFDFFVSRSVRAFAFPAVSLTTAANLPAVLPIIVAALTSALWVSFS
jgi:hypothetical protein